MNSLLYHRAMFRVKLSIAIAVLLGIVLTLAVALFWGMQQAEYHFHRSQLANTATLAYIDLSHDAYRHFKELTDILALNSDTVTNGNHPEQTRQQLFAAIQEARSSIKAEIDHIADDEDEDETQELKQLAEIELTLHQAIWRLERVRVLRGIGAKRSAQEMLATALDETIDQKFKSMIDSAITEELREMALATQRANRVMRGLQWIAMATATLATTFALTMGWLLWRSLSAPVHRLVMGVREVAKGDLEHRITLPGRNEFTYIAKNFNQMTEQLSQQRTELLEAQAGLEQQVRQRTRELQEANDRLNQLDGARRRFFADISHELRTPLTAIRGEAEVTLRGRDKNSDEYRTALRRIIDLSAQLAQLVEDLLLLARSESTSVRFEMQSLSFGELVHAICDEAGTLAQSKQLTLTAKIPATAITIHGDIQRLRQLLLILIDNACRYTPAGGGTITAALTANQTHASLTVTDQGIGIATEELGQIFKRHFRGERARRVAPSGSGLGLALAKTIVAAHQGSISLTSTPDQGTAVTVVLPLLTPKEKK